MTVRTIGRYISMLATGLLLTACSQDPIPDTEAPSV